MHKSLLTAALMAAAAATAKRPERKGDAVKIKARPEAPEVCFVNPPKIHSGDQWRRTGKRKGRRAS